VIVEELRPTDIVDDVRAVLAAARRGKGDRPNYLTAFQILDRLPDQLRARLIRERTAGGADAGVVFAASGVVSRAARMAGAEVEYLDSIGLSVQVAGQSITPSYEVCAVYRLPAADPTDAEPGAAPDPAT
jgi:hypothetical protein